MGGEAREKKWLGYQQVPGAYWLIKNSFNQMLIAGLIRDM